MMDRLTIWILIFLSLHTLTIIGLYLFAKGVWHTLIDMLGFIRGNNAQIQTILDFLVRKAQRRLHELDAQLENLN